MVNVIGADAGIAFMNAKYHYLFWRPVTAIDPTSVSPDGYGPSRALTTAIRRPSSNRAGGRCLRRRTIPSTRPRTGRSQARMGDVLSAFLGTTQINIDVHGFDPNGPAGNLNAVHHFATVGDLLTEAGNARVWAGLHYRFSVVAGNTLGFKVADYDLQHAFQPVELVVRLTANLSQSGHATSAPRLLSPDREKLAAR